MARIVLSFLLLLMLSPVLMANNVKIVRDVTLDVNSVTAGNFAIIDFAISWENSWRDDYNWDAVYVFLKFKKTKDQEWKHVYLMDQGFHTVNNGFTYWVGKTTTEQNKGQGIFIYRNGRGTGEAHVDVKLQWSYALNGLTKSDFLSSDVECSATCLEMVYVPKGAFCLGDGVSDNSLGTQYRPILPEWDLIQNNGIIKYTTDGDASSEEYKTYPPENAANRVNETRSGVRTNAWCGKAGVNNFTVNFGRKRKILYIGVSGVVGLTNNRPDVWAVYGSKDGDAPWIPLLTNLTKEDWAITPQSYPVAHALKLTTVDSFQYYRISIQTSTYAPMANNIAMTEVDVAARTDYAYVVDRQSPIVMNTTTELSAAYDPATWTGTLNATFPTGYEGFYVMKYEISQEQYLRFLNKLQYKQQKMRTIGDKLDNLSEGSYVYSGGATKRNGIIIGQRVDGGIVFTSDYNRSNAFSQPDDGKTIACNYLSPADMLAYADWAGLRPLSEMEYEKMSRRPFPTKPKLKEWAWGSNAAADLRLPAKNSFINPGTSNEQLSANGGVKPNVNAGNVLDGPVRTGAFAANAVNLTESGASFWGVMELTGNLAEIYYTVSQPGRGFQGIQLAHGDGQVYPESNGSYMGNTDISASYWPQTENAFIVKGGSFKTAKKDELAVSDRSFYTYFVGKGLNVKDSTVTFRLGHSYTNQLQQPICTTYLKLANKQYSAPSPMAKDSVCNGQQYVISGSPLLYSSSKNGNTVTDVALNMDGKIDYIWYVSEDKGVTWKIIRGAEGQHLTYSDFYNDDNNMREVYFKRRTVTPTFDTETNPISLSIINNNYSINRLRDTINMSNHTLGFLVETKSKSDFIWSWKKPGTSPQVLQATQKNSNWDYFFAERDNFDNIADSTHTLICDMTVLNKCTRRSELFVYVAKREASVMSSDIAIDSRDPKKKCGVMMIDKRDKDIYGTVQIGNQCWMAENLRYVVPSYTVFQSPDPAGKDPTGKKRGAMYNWNSSVVSNACPEGWRMPSNADVNLLNATLNADGANRVGEKLRAGNYWANSPANKALMGRNTSGFGLFGSGNYNNSNLTTYGFIITTDNYYYQIPYNNNDGFYTPTYYYWWNGWHNLASWHHMPIRCIKK